MIDNENYQTLITEIMIFSLSDLDEIIAGFDDVFNRKYNANSFSGQHMASVDYDRETARISHFDELIGTEPTIEVYNMLKAYRDKLIEYESSSQK